MNFEKNKIEFIDDIVNPDYYNITNKWDEILFSIKKFSKKKRFTFTVDNLGNEDYLWATLSGKTSKFDEDFLEEALQSWDNINKTIRGKIVVDCMQKSCYNIYNNKIQEELKMKKFKFKVVENGSPMEFEGETVANNEAEAIEELKEWYAMELGTIIDEISISIK